VSYFSSVGSENHQNQFAALDNTMEQFCINSIEIVASACTDNTGVNPKIVEYMNGNVDKWKRMNSQIVHHYLEFHA
jgi:hypothetical protein